MFSLKQDRDHVKIYNIQIFVSEKEIPKMLPNSRILVKVKDNV